MLKKNAIKVYKTWNPKYSLRKVAANLTELNRRYEILEYILEGPIFRTNEIVINKKVNAGRYNILLGQHWCFGNGGHLKHHTYNHIHPNMYDKHRYHGCKFFHESILGRPCFGICLGEAKRAYQSSMRRLDFCEAAIMIEDMLSIDFPEYWIGRFNINTCKTCGDLTSEKLCATCSSLSLARKEVG